MATNAPLPLVQATGLGFTHPGTPVFAGLDFRIVPGLSLLRGGDGRGKTTLLRVLAGTLQPTAGRLQRAPGATVFHATLADPALDAVVAQDWLAAQAAAHPDWNAGLAAALQDAFALGAHLAKPLCMLSTGSRRKLGLVAAAASGATLTLLDTPYGGLDAPSGRVLSQLLAEAAEGAQGRQGRQRAWVLADHGLPPALDGVRLAALVDLGD